MTDPILRAFAQVHIPEPGADFERAVAARLAPLHAARLRSARRTMVAYWIAASAASAPSLAHLGGSPEQLVVVAAMLTGIVGCSVIAAGGARSLARALLATYKDI